MRNLPWICTLTALLWVSIAAAAIWVTIIITTTMSSSSSSSRGSLSSSNTVRSSPATLAGAPLKTHRDREATQIANALKAIWRTPLASTWWALGHHRACRVVRNWASTNRIVQVKETRPSARSSSYVITMGRKLVTFPPFPRDLRRKEKRNFNTNSSACRIKLLWPLNRRSFSKLTQLFRSEIQRI